MKNKYLLKGIIKSIPGIEYIYNFHKQTGGSCNARYCYVVWLTHLTYAFQNGVKETPKHVVELGPGDTLGTGFAALITGADKYYALDIVRYTNVEESLKIFDELVLLFKNKIIKKMRKITKINLQAICMVHVMRQIQIVFEL